MLRKLLVAALGLALCGLAAAAEWNLQPPASALAADIHWIHELVMVLVIVLFVGVFGFMLYACYAHRKSIGHQAEQFHENTTVEILWTMVPAFIMVLIAWPVTKAVIAQKDTSNPDLTIKVTGIQWKWAYDYLSGEGEGISFVSTLGTPRAQIEGREAKGEHHLLEVDHELVVRVVSQEDCTKWVGEQKSLIARAAEDAPAAPGADDTRISVTRPQDLRVARRILLVLPCAEAAAPAFLARRATGSGIRR